MPDKSYTIQSLDAAFAVLDYFLQSMGTPQRFIDICSATGLSKNRTYRILATLCDWGYLDKDPKTKEYGLGTTFLIMGELYRQNRRSLQQAALPIIQALAAKSGDFVCLVVPYRENRMLVTEAVQGAYSLQGRSGVGEIYSLQGGAASRFLLAALPAKTRTQLLANLEFQRLTEKIVLTRGELEREIQVAVSQGYYIAEEDLEPGLVSVAAPIRDETGQIVAAISLVIPTVRFTSEHRRRAIELVVDGAQDLSEKLGYFERTTGGTPPR